MSRMEALVTPSVLQWAREQAKMSIADAARRIRRPIEDIEAWENGSVRPSIAQARKASEVYRRPLATFYLPQPPMGFATLRDFRSLPDAEPRELSSELALLIRTTRYRQQWMREHLLHEGLDPLDFVGSASLANSPRDIALDILRVLHLSPQEQQECHTRDEARRMWVKRVEMAGIFVFRRRQIAVQEARGFVISDDMAPFVYLNSCDSEAAQVFTLAHELAHLWLDLSGISNLEPTGRTVDHDTARIEIFCNRVAAETVLEEQAFNQQWHSQTTTDPLEQRIQRISVVFKVSEECVARRLLEKGIISQDRYLSLRQLYQERWRRFEAREKERRKSSKAKGLYYVTTVSKNGYAFTQTVVGAFLAGAVSGREASSLLDVKVNHLRKLGETAGIHSGLLED